MTTTAGSSNQGIELSRRKAGDSDSNSEEAQDALPATLSPFPTCAVATVGLAQLVNAMFVTNLFPYMGFMVQDLTGIADEEELGFMAGYVAAAFMAGRILTSAAWGKWSDTYGRKPVLVVGCLCVAFSSLAFGLSFAYWWAVTWRCIGGLLNGISAAGKTAIAEICGKEHEAKGMSFVSGAWGAGLVLGPALGGLLGGFHKSKYAALRELAPEGSFFRQYAYFLPNLILALLSIVAAACVLTMQEPLKRLTAHKQLDEEEDDLEIEPLYDAELGEGQDTSDVELIPTIDPPHVEVRNDDLAEAGSAALIQQPADQTSQPMYERPVWKQPVVVYVVALYTFMSCVEIMFDEVFPLWAIVKVANGGLGMDTTELGEIMTAMGVGLLIFQVTIFPTIVNKLGARQLFAWCMIISVPVMFLFPAVGLMTSGTAAQLVVIIIAVLWKNWAAIAAFTTVFILINRTVPAHRRGAVNGFAMTVSSCGKALAPVAAGTLFAWSETNGLSFPLDFHFTWILVGFMTTGCAVMAWCAPRALDDQAQLVAP